MWYYMQINSKHRFNNMCTPRQLVVFFLLFFSGKFARGFGSFRATGAFSRRRISTCVNAGTANFASEEIDGVDRRRAMLSLPVLISLSLFIPSPASAQKSRTDGYEVQMTEAKWKDQLSSMQYYILREGGTENPRYSVLESEKREGVFECAGCGTPLFESKYKFNSGTGWPSFAQGLPSVEVENVNKVQATLAGAELRCGTCGGHLGDVFQDGYLFVGTEAQKSGQRFCIDGAALIFRPTSGESPLRGDVKAGPKPTPSWLQPPAITPNTSS